MNDRRLVIMTLACLALACLALAWPADPARAQNALGDGRRLDNNLQVGSGGINQPQAVPNYRARNDLITGNVSGLGYFRDRVGYRAPNEFGDRLGSDDLFRFRAQSLAPSTTGVPGVTSLGGYQAGSAGPFASVYRDLSGVTVGQVSQGLAGSTGLLLGSQGVTYRAFAPSATDPSLNVPQGLGRAFGVLSQPNGRLLEVTASPLLGLRQRVLREGTEPTAQLEPTPGTTPGPAPAAAVPPEAAPPVAVPLPTVQDPGGRISAMIDPRTGEPVQSGLLDAWRRVAPWTPAVELGSQIQALVESPPTQAAAVLNERAAQIESALFKPNLTKEPAPGQDVYADLLRQLREHAAGGAPKPPVKPAPGAEGDDVAALAPPSAKAAAEAAAARQRAMRLARGLPAEPDPNAPSQPAQADPDAAPVPGAVGHVLKMLDYDLPAIASLAGRGDDNVNRWLKQAETAMAAGAYFDAEKRYHLVLTAMPDHPMARVGLVHAQLGAGLVRSAAFNLRRLFDEHPELIAARYDAALLPGSQRLAWVRSQLDALIKTSNRQEPALLLAYLGHQSRSQELVKYGLDLAQARAPRDPLITLLRRVWLKGGSAVQGPNGDQRDAKNPAGQSRSPENN